MLFSGLKVGNPPLPTSVPSLFSPIPIPSALPNDPQGLKGNLVLPGSVDAGGDLTSGGDVVSSGDLRGDQDLVVEGAADIGMSLTTGARPGVVGGHITCTAPGVFVGNGSGLTNLPPATLTPTPDFFFQSNITNFGIVTPNRFVPEDPLGAAFVNIPCDLFNRPPGLYFWKTDAAISLQNLFNSASGFVWWDGTKVSGQTSWSQTQFESIDNPVYSLTLSYLFFTSLTGFFVSMESGNSSINPAQPTDYYVNFYKIATINTTPAPNLPAPDNLNVATNGNARELTIAFDPVVGATFYVATLTDSTGTTSYVGNSMSPIVATGLISDEPYSVVVRAQNATQTGLPTPPVVQTTEPPPPPPAPTASNITNNSFDVNWVVDPAYSSYDVIVQQGANPPETYLSAVSPLSVTLYGGVPLDNLTKYVVTLQGTGLGPSFLLSSPSAPLVVTTEP